MEAILALLVFVLFIQMHSIGKRLSALEAHLGTAPAATPPLPTPTPSVAVTNTLPVQEATLPEEHPVSAPVPVEPSFIDRGIEWLKHDTLLKIGAFFLLLGFAWLVTYAFMNNWIGPVGRIALGIIAGLGLLVFGFLRIPKFADQGSIFLGLGASILILTTYAARFQYDFLSPFVALGFIYLVSLFVSYASYAYRLRSLAFMGLVIAAVSPLLTNGAGDRIGLFSYLLIVMAGTLWLAAATAWRELTTAAVIVVVFYSLPFFGSKPVDMETLAIFAFVFAAVFSIANIFNILRSRTADGLPEMTTAFLNATLLMLWILNGVSDMWQGLMLAAWMVVFSGGSFVVYQLTGTRKTFLVYAAISIAYLAAATAVELDGATLTIALAAEAIAISLLAFRLTGRQTLSETLSFLLFPALLLSIESIFDSSWRTSIPFDHFSALLFLAAGLSVLGYLFLIRSGTDSGSSILGRVWLYSGSAYFYLLLWLTFHAIIATDIATMFSLVVYTIIGLGAYVFGKLNEQNSLRLYGSALLGFVIVHLLIVDVWQMDLVGRIITFFIIGILLMSTTFVKPRQIIISSGN